LLPDRQVGTGKDSNACGSVFSFFLPLFAFKNFGDPQTCMSSEVMKVCMGVNAVSIPLLLVCK